MNLGKNVELGYAFIMGQLSTQSFERAVRAASHLRAGEKHVRVLRSVSWAPEISQEFFAGNCEKLPRIEYPTFDGTKTRESTASARALIAGDHPVFDWLRRIADTLERAALMLEHVGTPEFYTYSVQLYGTPQQTLLDKKTRVIDLARHMDAALSGLDFDKLVLGGVDMRFGACEFGDRLSRKLDKHFDCTAPRIEIVPNLSSKALAGAKRIRIDAAAQFSPLDVRQLLHHEALVHVGTALNGRAQNNFPILGAAHAGTTEIQEGLAVFAEIITGAMDPSRFRRLVDRVVAIDMSVKGADFIEVYRYFLEQNDNAHQAFEDTRRVFRGGVMKGGAPFTKDGVYLNGLLRVHNFMRTVIKLGRADLIRLLFVGKLDIEDVPALASLAASGYLTAPAILPPWAKDMRFLVSYLAYSSFLNQVKLPGFQAYYQDRLADVPDVWGLTVSP